MYLDCECFLRLSNFFHRPEILHQTLGRFSNHTKESCTEAISVMASQLSRSLARPNRRLLAQVVVSPIAIGLQNRFFAFRTAAQRIVRGESSSSQSNSHSIQIGVAAAAALTLASAGTYLNADPPTVDKIDKKRAPSELPPIKNNDSIFLSFMSLPTMACDPIRTKRGAQPRNAMVNTRKSKMGRGLYDKVCVITSLRVFHFTLRLTLTRLDG